MNVCMILKNHEHVHVKHGISYLYPEASIRACAIKHKFDNADSRIVQMIIFLKSFRLFTDLKDERKT